MWDSAQDRMPSGLVHLIKSTDQKEGMTVYWPIFSIVVSLLAFGVAAWLYRWVNRLPTAEGPIGEIGT
jgi:hypothetical protein